MVRRETASHVNAILVLLIMMLAVLGLSAVQQTVPTPAQAGLEVASITRNTSGTETRGGIRFNPSSGELQATNVTLAKLLKFAYQRHSFDEREVTGGPAWVTVDRFDVLIRVAGGHVFDADGLPRNTLTLLFQEAELLALVEPAHERLPRLDAGLHGLRQLSHFLFGNQTRIHHPS